MFKKELNVPCLSDMIRIFMTFEMRSLMLILASIQNKQSGCNDSFFHMAWIGSKFSVEELLATEQLMLGSMVFQLKFAAFALFYGCK